MLKSDSLIQCMLMDQVLRKEVLVSVSVNFSLFSQHGVNVVVGMYPV